MAALRVAPDGRASTVTRESGLAGLLATAIHRLWAGIEITGEPDPVSQDLLIGIAADLEKQHWMFEAQTR